MLSTSAKLIRLHALLESRLGRFAAVSEWHDANDRSRELISGVRRMLESVSAWLYLCDNWRAVQMEFDTL